jgi:hypothetical protein
MRFALFNVLLLALATSEIAVASSWFTKNGKQARSSGLD